MTPERSSRQIVDRRTTIKWLAATMAAAGSGCTTTARFVGEEIPPAPQTGNLLLGSARTPASAGYGGDPDLVNPAVPWPRTMTDVQLDLAAAVCDVILPADDRSPAASAVGVHEFIDEWVSAPYPQQQQDRALILHGLEWLERRCRERFDSGFSGASTTEQASLVDTIARPNGGQQQQEDQIEFFTRFRYLAVGAFYTTQLGMADIGYIGNVPINGDYPGPNEAAMEHLSGVLRQLGLTPPAA